MVSLEILMKSDYGLLLLLNMSRLKSLNKSTQKIHQKLKKWSVIVKDTGKVKYSQLPMG